MGEWIIGYPNGLDNCGSVKEGKDLYATMWAGTRTGPPISLTAVDPYYDSGKVASASGKTVSIPNANRRSRANFPSSVDGGSIVGVYGKGSGIAHKIASHTDESITLVDSNAANDFDSTSYVKIVNGDSSFMWSSSIISGADAINQDNPHALDIVHTFNKSGSIDFSLEKDGIEIGMGESATSYTMQCIFRRTPEYTNVDLIAEHFRKQISKKLSYTGEYASSETTQCAPQILQIPSGDGYIQYPVRVVGWKETGLGIEGDGMVSFIVTLSNINIKDVQ
ncbi:MAG: hypothetical protein ACTSPB_02020 [Candidatus Thorarchaeota archaeon]